MKYLIRKNQGPIYLQLYRQLRDDIIQGVLEYGSRLPSKRFLADELGISTVSAEHAYALLCDEGYVQARERSGYFVIFRSADGFAGSAPVGETAPPVLAALSDSPAFPPSLLAKAVRKVLSEQQPQLFVKAPGRGCIQLRQALKAYLARNRGINVETEQIIIGSGSEYLYRLIVELFGRKGMIAIEDPSYNKIEQVYMASGIELEMLPLTGDGIDSSALAASRATILHTTPYRSFPSGVSASASKRHEYIRWAAKPGRYIIEDDYESEFSLSSKPCETLFALSEQDNVIYLNTFSKTISPGLRAAYMVLPKALLKPFEERLGFYSCTVPSLEQYVLSELINSGSFERHINRIRRRMRREQNK